MCYKSTKSCLRASKTQIFECHLIFLEATLSKWIRSLERPGGTWRDLIFWKTIITIRLQGQAIAMKECFHNQ